MRFSEFNIKEYTDPTGLPPERIPSKPWVAKSALDKDQDIGDKSYQEQPAYQRKGVNPPVLTKPKVNLADPKQKAEYLNRINQQQQKDWGTISPGKQPQPTMSLANDPVGQATAGEPALNKTQPPAVWKNQRTGQSSTSPVNTTQTPVTPAKPPAPSTAQTPTTQAKPTISTTAPATSSLSQVGNTLSNIRKGMGKGSEYTNVYAPTGPTSFMNQQYVKDLEKEFARTPNDPNIRAELDKMRAPGIVAAKGTGTSGGRTTDINDPRLTANIQPGSSDIRGTGRGPGMANDPRNLTNNPNALGDKETIVPKQPSTSSATAAKPTVSTGTSTPAQSTTSSYKGSAGSQAIQQLNPNIKDVNKIYAGDTIKLPGGGSYTVKQGDTLDNIAKQSGTTTNTQTDNSTETNKQAEKLKALAQDPSSMPNVIPDEEPKNDNSVNSDPSSVQAESESLNRIKSLAGLK